MSLIVVNTAKSIEYNYDSLNRLTRVVYDNETAIEYTYDAAGNRMRKVSTLLADTSIDCNVDFSDFAKLASHWLDEDCGYADQWCDRADIDWDTEVGIEDLAIVTQQWLNSVE
jgi:YD repeat-containing protein